MKKYSGLSALFTLLVVMALSLCLTSCENSDEAADGTSLTGTWVSKYGNQYVFKSNGTGYYKDGDVGNFYYEDEPFDAYKVKDGKLLIKWSGDHEYDVEGLIRVSSRSFTLCYDEPWDDADTEVFNKK